jgi:transposase
MDYSIEQGAWEQILSFLITFKGIHTRNEKDLRRFIEAVGYVMRGGCQWRLLPAYYGQWRSVPRRFKYWAERGVWAGILAHVSKDYDGECVMIDATIVRAHPCAAGYQKDQHEREALGRSKGGFTTKIHAVVDALGQALRFTLTPGQRHDITQASQLLEGFENTQVIADKGYDSDALMEQLTKQNCTPIIPPRSNRKTLREYDKHLYKERHLIECFFNKIKHFRRVFSRFDKAAQSFMAFLCFASTLIWLR